MDRPAVLQYQHALDEFRREGREGPLLKRMSELISLLDLTTTLSSDLSREEILEAALLIVMGELQASRGGLFVRDEAGQFRLRASRGLPAAAAEFSMPAEEGVVLRGAEARLPGLGLEVLCPVVKAGRSIAYLGLGPRADGRPYGEEEGAFLSSVAACAATPIENGLMYHELRRVNQKLSVKVFQLNNLFDISREFTVSLDEETIKHLVTTTLMGHLLVSRCALYLQGEGGLSLAHERGLRGEADAAFVPEGEARRVLDALLGGACAVTGLPEGRLKERLLSARMALVVPLALGGRPEGLLAVGERASGVAFSDEDREFALTLGRQAIAALETVRLHRMRLEKQRQDRELQIAREIQQSLFPSSRPIIPGFEVAAESHPCYEVGGDHFDFIPLPLGRLALTIADIAGKGTPASILMASVHASLRALAGTLPPALLLERLNRFLFESTQSNKYVTLAYAELDPRARRLVYVTAGHVPPYLIGRGGARQRLTKGGPVLGLLEEVSFEVGELSLEEGDTVAMVTDGATEALSPAEVEFGDDRVFEALEAAESKTAGQTVGSLVRAVHSWTAPRGCSDDLTVLVLKALSP
jgi:sigma-B regulation protein RsbU (phosphoserine phosphatase)